MDPLRRLSHALPALRRALDLGYAGADTSRTRGVLAVVGRRLVPNLSAGHPAAAEAGAGIRLDHAVRLVQPCAERLGAALRAGPRGAVGGDLRSIGRASGRERVGKTV